MQSITCKNNLHGGMYLAWVCILCALLAGCAQKTAPDDPWTQLEEIKAQINPPEFPDKSYLITEYGAVGDGETKNTEAFRKAIDEAHNNGGGKVIVPGGVFLTGAIHLKSNVNLHLQDKARILFSRDPRDYLPVVFTRFEGMDYMNYSPFIYAYQQENIAITGQGTIDGNADSDHWWSWAHSWNDRDRLLKMNEEQVPAEDRIFGEGYQLRPNFVQFYEVKNILLSGVKFIRSPMWTIHPVLSENITIDGIRIESLGSNNDGVNPESSKNVWIKNSYFDTGDDCIAIKSGRNEDGRRIDIPSENIIIEDNQMVEGNGGVVMGSEISGGVRNVFAQNLKMDSPDLERVLRIKTSSKRGGVVENIFMRNVEVGQFKEAAIKVNMHYGEPGEFMPVVRNISVDNLQIKRGGEYGILIHAYPESPVENISIMNSEIRGVDVPLEIDHIKDLHTENLYINGEMIDIKKNKGNPPIGKLPE